MTIDQEQAVRRFKELGVADAESRLDPYTQGGIFGDLERGTIDAEAFRAGLSEITGRQMTMEECLYGWRGYCADVPHRNLEALKRLRTEGYRVILLSNTNPFMMSWAMSTDFDGQGHSLEEYMDACYMSYKVGAMKPDEAFFTHVLAAEGIEPSETLFLDDGKKNIETAARLGIHTFPATNGEDWTKEIYEYLK